MSFAAKFNPPSPLNFQAPSWEDWSQRFARYRVACKLDKEDGVVQVSTLIYCMGPEADKIYKSFSFSTDAEANEYTVVLQKFSDHFIPKVNIIYERSRFYTRNQKDGESVEEFVRALYDLSDKCKFHDRDEMIRDRLVIGLADREVCEKLQLKGDLTLTNAVEMARTHEMVKKQNATPTIGVDAITGRSRHKFTSSSAPSRRPQQRRQDDQRRQQNDRRQQQRGICQRCGRDKSHATCPAIGKTCNICQKPNHFGKMCRLSQQNKTVHALNDGTDSDEAWVGAVTRENAKAWFVQVKMLDGSLDMKVDTGAEANVIPSHMWKRFKTRPLLQKTGTTLKTVDDTEIIKDGVATVEMTVGESVITDTVYITKTGACAILGLKSSIKLKLVTPGQNGDCLQVHSLTAKSLVDNNPDVFTGLGLYPDEYHIKLKEDAQPVIQPPRRVPPVLHDALKKKLQEMVKMGVIAAVEQPTKWVNSLVIAKKTDGSLRLCLDPKDLNRCIERELFEIPTFEQIISSLGGKKFFSTLDQKDSYWQVKLDEESSLLTTFNTPFGRYRFMRMPFGITSASEILQRNTYKVFGDIENVHCLTDDMLIAAATEEEHDKTVRKVMERARQHGVKFNPKKVQLKQPEITYMGRKITAEGIKPDPAKVRAIQNMPLPTDTHGVKRLLGMVNFLAPFIPDMATITSPLRNLLKKDEPWQWKEEHTQAVNELKKILSKEPALRLYDSSKKTTIQCDSSSTGLGACLLQDGCPIAYASRSLTTTEKKYAQIEKEMLAIVFAAEHFHQYVYGQQIEVLSDHKPIETIMRKPLHKASPRLQLMMLRLLRYKLQVRFTPGSKMYIADTLSRAYQMEEHKPKEFEEDSLRVHSLTSAVPATKSKLEEIREETEKDQTLNIILQSIRDGEWPQSTFEDSELRRLKPIQHELSEEKGIIFFGNRMLIPRSLRKETLINLHKGHLGMEKSKAKARQSIYWPGLSQDIDNAVMRCQVCAKHQNQKTKEPLLQHEIPDQPWKKIGADIFEFQGKDYLVVVDYFSRYPEVAMLRGKGTKAVVEVMKPIFARHGIPDELIADNNPFGSREMREFAKEWDFKIITSSPHYPQSNGQAERYVNIVKTILKKAKEDKSDPNIALLAYRNCPVTGLQFSPAQLLMGRQLKDLTTQSPTALINTEAKQQMEKSRRISKQYYDQQSKQCEPFYIGQPVRVLTEGEWQRSVVCGHGNTPRSYMVKDEYGKTLRRNSKVIRPSQHTPRQSQSHRILDDDDDKDHAPAASQRASSDVSIPRPTVTDGRAVSPNSPPLQDTLTQAPSPEVRLTSEPNNQTNATYTTRSGRSVIKPIKYTY